MKGKKVNIYQNIISIGDEQNVYISYWLSTLLKVAMVIIFMSSCAKKQDNSARLSPAEAAPIMVIPPVTYNYPCTGTNCKTVLSIGDSISVGYNAFLGPKINADYNLFHPSENCRNSWYTDQHIDQWLTEHPHPDVIIWNDGIWNTVNSFLAHSPGNFPEQYGTSLEDYEAQLIEIAGKLKATGARVIFFTSTQLDPATEIYFDWWKIDQLNQVAMDALPGLGIEVADLHAVSMTITDQHVDGIHYNSVGYTALASFIEKKILNQ